jgi:hypothetical protein
MNPAINATANAADAQDALAIGLVSDAAITQALQLVRQLQALEIGRDWDTAVELHAAVKHLERAAGVWFGTATASA